MWSKKKLEGFVALSIITATILTTLRVVILVNYRAGALLIFISSFIKMLISYLNMQTFDFKIRYVFIVASLSFIGASLGAFSYYFKISSTSYVISSDLQHLFIALIATVWHGVRYSCIQYFGLLMILTGFIIEVSSAETPSDVPIHIFIGSLSGLFNAVSLIVFESKIKPVLVDFKSLWSYMTAYGFYLTVFSSLHLVEEILSKRSSYVEAITSPVIYLVLLAEVGMTYILSEVSPFLDSVERSTLLNVSTGFSAVISDLYLSHEIEIQRFLGFSFVVIGVQVFNFFWR